MRRRRRVDWEEEERKTSRARIQGLKYSFVSILAALGVSGALKMRYPDLDFFPVIKVLAALLGGILLMILLGRKK